MWKLTCNWDLPGDRLLSQVCLSIDAVSLARVPMSWEPKGMPLVKGESYKGNPHKKLGRLEREPHSASLCLSFLRSIRWREHFPITAALFLPVRRLRSQQQKSPRQFLGLVVFTRRTHRPQHRVIFTAKIYDNKKIRSKISTGKRCVGLRTMKMRHTFPKVSPSGIIQHLLDPSNIKL